MKTKMIMKNNKNNHWYKKFKKKKKKFKMTMIVKVGQVKLVPRA